MSQAPNPYNNAPGQQAPNPGIFQQYSQVPANNLAGTTKQDGNSNSTVPGIPPTNHYTQSANSSPAFNNPGMFPPPTSLQSSPMRPIKPVANPSQVPTQNIPPNVSSQANMPPAPSYYPPNIQQGQINNNAPPLVPSSQFQPFVNGPLGPPSQKPPSQYPPSSATFSPTPVSQQPPGPLGPPFQRPPSQFPPSSTSFSPTPVSQQPPGPFGPPSQRPPSQYPPSSTSFNLKPVSQQPSGPVGPPSQRPPNQFPPSSNSFSPTPVSQQPLGPGSYMPGMPPSMGAQRPPTSVPSTSQPNVPFSGPLMPGSRNSPMMSGVAPSGPRNSPSMGPPTSIIPSGSQGPGVPSVGPPKTNLNGPSIPPPQMGPPRGIPSGPSSLPPMPGFNHHNGPMSQPTAPGYQQGPPNANSGPPSMPGMSGPSMPIPPMPQPMPGGQGAMNGPPKTNFQNRYPPMPPSNLTPQQQAQIQQNIAKQFPQSHTYGVSGVTQQMNQLSVTKQGFDQLWGHQMVDLMQCKHILPEYPEDPPEIKLGHQFAEAPNCSPEIFRCTVNRIPETNNLLQKSRLPLGILIHPFKDLNHLPVIQCTTIVRCRACRTYINPFVYFVDAKRWKCNLCYRVNDLPEEFQYDPVSKSYGDPSRRPEIKSATIEFIAPSEYMLRPPQPAVYLFLLDVSQVARDSGYLQIACDTIKENLDQMPGDARMQIGFICYDAHIHYYLMSDGRSRPQEMTVLDIDDIFLPSPESLLVNLGENRDMVTELLTILPKRFANPGAPASALGAALQAAHKLMAPTGGRITVFQTCLPNIGPGALQSREDPNARSGKEVAHLNPATDFYKRLALDSSGAQVAIDLFLLSAHYCDLATLSGMSKFSGGSVHHIPLFRGARAWQAAQLRRMLARYLTRKIGFEAVMRVRCTRGISIHTFHGNFFVRSTDLLSLPNVSPDAGFGMQLTIEESLADLQQVCFQAALLYTSSRGERRIRVHTLALPIANTLPDVLHAADQQAMIGLLAKMAVDRCASASMSEAREALTNVAVDVLCAQRLAQNLPAGALSPSLQAPMSLRLLPLYILALLKRKAFRTGTSTRLDERVGDMLLMKSAPLGQLLRAVYPDLYALHTLAQYAEAREPDPPRLHLTAERINSNGAYLLDDGETMMIYICHGVSPAWLSDTFGVAAYTQIQDDARELPLIESEGNELLHAFIEKLNEDRPYPANIVVLRDNSPSKTMFTERLVDDRVESAFSYYEFLQHIKNQVK
ncbi:protein transport protein Sec24A [Aricia agestis]|uniref:protein transport protein Sec24A n=1 Tax=Aricia agestis TaxID=91739 RepID=UPI001C204D13|nr:protein transport protein Sec24A [Aricia agestis]XP_041976128.1 protein transport protein Sec24A [Aricia agestis]